MVFKPGWRRPKFVQAQSRFSADADSREKLN